MTQHETTQASQQAQMVAVAISSALKREGHPIEINGLSKRTFSAAPQRVCFNCGKSGHWSNQCPHSRKEPP